jgi:hypothetical protein
MEGADATIPILVLLDELLLLVREKSAKSLFERIVMAARNWNVWVVAVAQKTLKSAIGSEAHRQFRQRLVGMAENQADATQMSGRPGLAGTVSIGAGSFWFVQLSRHTSEIIQSPLVLERDLRWRTRQVDSPIPQPSSEDAIGAFLEKVETWVCQYQGISQRDIMREFGVGADRAHLAREDLQQKGILGAERIGYKWPVIKRASRQEDPDSPNATSMPA